MTYYEHATQLALRLGRWGCSGEYAWPKTNVEIEVELAKARQQATVISSEVRRLSLLGTLSGIFKGRCKE